MNEEKYRCTKCGAMEVVFEEKSADPFDVRTARLVCQKCGYVYEPDSGIRLINNKTVNTFPSPKNDLDVDDTLTEKIKSKRRVD